MLGARALMLTCGVLAFIAVPSAQQASKREAAAVEQKVNDLAARGAQPGSTKASRPVRTVFTEREVNVYLQSTGKEYLPEGVRNPEISMAGDQRIMGRALVDLDAVRKSKDRSWLDPAAYLTGSVEVRATGLLRTADGRGTFVLESATVGSLPLPKSLLQELVSYYSRTPDTPEGFTLDAPFDLPANIREVLIQRGAATVIQ